MTSKLIVNSLAADTGVSTITFADQAKMGNSLFHSTGFTIGDSFLHSTGVNLTNVNATGVITATKFVGEVSVGSSITFEDNEKAYFGTSTDFSIYHNGSASYLDETGTGGLIAKTNTAFQVFNSAGSQAAFTATPGGSVDLYHNTTKVLETKAYGIDITGGFVATGDCSIADKITHAGDLNTAIRFPAADTISFDTAGNERLRINSSGRVGIGTNDPNNPLTIHASGNHIYLKDTATNNILQIRHASGVAEFNTFGTGGARRDYVFNQYASEVLRIRSTGQVRLPTNGQELTWGASQQMKFYYENSEERMYLKGDGAYGFAFRVNNGNALEIDKTTRDVSMQGASGRNFVWDNSEPSLYLTDNGTNSARLKIGTGGDLQLYHDVSGNVNHIVAATNGEVKFSANEFSFYDYSGVTERARIKSTGDVKINSGDIYFATAGKGIVLGTTSNQDAHTLDHYQEGTTGLTVKCGSVTVPLLNNTCKWTRIGNTLHLSAWIRVSGGTSASGLTLSDSIKITGFPFAGVGNNTGRTRLVFTGYGFYNVTNASALWGWMVVSDGATSTEHELHWGNANWSSINTPTGNNITTGGNYASSEIYLNGHMFV